jgi:uncharacterized RDD family membrane protein YckC
MRECAREMKETTTQQRYAPPAAVVADMSGVTHGGLQLADRGLRVAAVIIDTAILMALFWVIARFTPLNVFRPSMAQAGLITKLGVQILSLSVFAFVNGYLLATRGQTVGKKLLGIRIVRSNGDAASLVRLLALRYGVGYLVAALHVALLFVYSMADCLMFFRADRRCLHDVIADTIVVKA